MTDHIPKQPPPTLGVVILRTAGSLWLAAVLLVLVLVAMACATVYESQHGTPQAAAAFYRTTWFRVLLLLLCVNVLLAMLIRYPFTRKQFGFVLTHGSIILILGGAWITHLWGLEAQLGIREGQTVSSLRIPAIDHLTVTKRGATPDDEAIAEADLESSVFQGFEPVEDPPAPTLTAGDVRVEVKAFLPNARWERDVVDGPSGGQPAVEVHLNQADGHATDWVFAGQSAQIGSHDAVFRVIRDAQAWQRALSNAPEPDSDSKGTVKITYQGKQFEFGLDDCLDKTVPIGETGLTLHVLRYFPHAVVGADNKTKNMSNQPRNPAIEFEVAGPSATEKRFAFAKFPDFRHGDGGIEGLDVVFAMATVAPKAPIEVLTNAENDWYVRFSNADGPALTRKIEIGQSIETPWPDVRLTVAKHYPHARPDWQLVAADADAGSKTRMKAIRVALTAGDQTQDVWLEKYRRRSVSLGTAVYDLSYGDKTIPLGFSVRLDKFRLGTYPGGMRPRSFESQITIIDPKVGGEQSRVVSMNHPTKYGGLSMFQSSYNQNQGVTYSFLSVSRDPGLPFVFAGYILLLLGMLVVLVQRMAERRLAERIKHLSAQRSKTQQTSIRRDPHDQKEQELVHT